jgi:hypothetical protein
MKLPERFNVLLFRVPGVDSPTWFVLRFVSFYEWDTILYETLYGCRGQYN